MNRRRHFFPIAALAALSLALPGAAAAKTHVFHATPGADGTYVFQLGELKTKRVIKRAAMSASGLRTEIRGKTMRRSIQNGKFQVAPFRVVGSTSSAASGTAKARLVVKTVRRKGAGNGGNNGGNNTSGGNGSAPIPTGTCAPGEVYKDGNWPGACWRPYNDSSPFNRKIGSDAPTAPRSDAIVKRLAGFGPPDALSSHARGEDDWSHPIFYSRPGDPEFTIHCVEDWGKCNGEGETIRIPDEARPASAGDGHLTVIDQNSGWEYDFWQVRQKPRGGGKLVVSWGGKTRIDGDGLGSDAVAAGYGSAAGVIRAPELASGRINHALFMVVKCTSGETSFPSKPKATGSVCSDAGMSNANAPAMGQRFQLQMSDSEINALPVPAWKKTILRAMAEYGLYVGDTGGGAWGIQFESSQTYLSFGYDDPFVAIGAQQGVPAWQGDRVFQLRDGVNWERHLRVVDPCTAKGSC